MLHPTLILLLLLSASPVYEVSKLLYQSSATDCDFDPIPASMFKQCASVGRLFPTKTEFNHYVSLSSGSSQNTDF